MVGVGRKTYYVSATKTMFYKGEWIEAESEEVARVEYKAGIEHDLVEVAEVDLQVDVAVEEADEKETRSLL